MSSVTYELLTYIIINVRSFHWILLRIEVDAAKVEIYDSKKYPESVTDKIKEALQR